MVLLESESQRRNDGEERVPEEVDFEMQELDQAIRDKVMILRKRMN